MIGRWTTIDTLVQDRRSGIDLVAVLLSAAVGDMVGLSSSMSGFYHR